MPEVSVIIPNYNREKLIPETLDSLFKQSLSDWEAIVVDDCSSDGSFRLLTEMAAVEPRLRVFQRQGRTKGGSACRNEGVKYARSEYVMFLDSDDLLAPSALEERVRIIKNSPDEGFIVFMTQLFASTPGDSRLLWNVFTEGPDINRFLRFDIVWNISNPIWRREVLNDSCASFQDWDLHVRALSSGIPYKKCNIVDHYYRRPPWATDQISSVSTSASHHLQSHERLFVRTYKHLCSSVSVPAGTEKRMIGPFWWLAERWRKQGDIGQANKIWSHAYELGLCKRHHYYMGKMLYKMPGRIVGDKLRAAFHFIVPSIFVKLGSKTFNSVASG